MLDNDAFALAVFVDGVEPLRHAGIVIDVFAEFFQGVRGQHRLSPCPLDHKIHHCKDTVHFLFVRHVVAIAPKVFGRHAKARDKAVVLHILVRERFVKIVNQCDNISFHTLYYTTRGKDIQGIFVQ